MPYRVLPDESEVKTKPVQVITEPHNKSRGDDIGSHPSLLEKLTILIAVWQYFKYTGKAIATGQKVPSWWAKMDVAQTIKRIKTNYINYYAPKSSNNGVTVPESETVVPKTKYRVVDIASGTPLIVQ